MITNWENRIKFVKWFLLVAIIVSISAYLYLVNDSVFTVVARQNNEEKISQLETEVSTLEADYMSRLNLITLNYAKSLGYLDATGQVSYFVKSRPVGLIAANNEI